MIPARVVVVSLARRADRLDGFAARWSAAAAGIGYQVLTADDRPGDPVAGCYASHVAALRSGPGPVLVLEDDAVFAPAFTLDLPEPPARWRLLRLGGKVRASGPGRAGAWTPVVRIEHTHAYVAADPGRLAAHLSTRLSTHRLAGRPAGSVAAALSFAGPGQYRLTAGTVGQAAGRSDITGVHSATDQFWD